MTIDTYVFPFSSINDNDDVFRKDTRIIDIPDVSEQECSMRIPFSNLHILTMVCVTMIDLLTQSITCIITF